MGFLIGFEGEFYAVRQVHKEILELRTCTNDCEPTTPLHFTGVNNFRVRKFVTMDNRSIGSKQFMEEAQDYSTVWYAALREKITVHSINLSRCSRAIIAKKKVASSARHKKNASCILSLTTARNINNLSI